VVVRKDIPRGVQSAMLVHAAGESSPGGLPQDTHAVVLTAPDEGALLCVAARLKLVGIRLAEVREPDAPWNNQLMAIGVIPARREVVGRYVSSLPLLR
jgi:hypothetical protein